MIDTVIIGSRDRPSKNSVGTEEAVPERLSRVRVPQSPEIVKDFYVPAFRDVDDDGEA